MSYLHHIRACNRYDLDHFRPFLVHGKTLGWVKPDFASALARFPHTFRVGERDVVLHPRLQTYEARSQAVAEAMGHLRQAGVIAGWRDELFPVTRDFHAPPLLAIERAAAEHFGLRAFGVHINGLVEKADGTCLWVARRARSKPTYPGMLDHLVAGGQPVGLGLLDNVVKECAEEAGVPETLARRAHAVGQIHYCMETDQGLKPDTLFTFDLQLPGDFVPQNTDGEVESFELWPLEKVAATVERTAQFKPNCNLVIIDLLLRRGLIGPEHPEHDAIRRSLYPELPVLPHAASMNDA